MFVVIAVVTECEDVICVTINDEVDDNSENNWFE